MYKYSTCVAARNGIKQLYGCSAVVAGGVETVVVDVGAVAVLM